MPSRDVQAEATPAGSVAAPAEFRPGDPFAGFVIEREIGRGRMGIVYRAKRLSLGRVEAVKIMAPAFSDDPEIRTRFKLEAMHAAISNHQNVVTVYDAAEREGRLYIAMEYIAGTDLRARIASDGAVPPVAAAEITRQVASALDAARSVGLIHRDVKPANILLAGERGRERAYLTDFGVSRRLDDPLDLTAYGSTVGTPHYTAPEAYQDSPVDHRADVYSLGCVLFEMLTGRKPFPGSSSTQVAIAHVTQPRPQVHQVGGLSLRAFDEVILKSMAKDPAERYQSAGELGAAAVAAAEQSVGANAVGGGPVARPNEAEGGDARHVDARTTTDRSAAATSRGPQSTKRSPKAYRVAALAAGVLIAAAAAAVILITTGGGSRPAAKPGATAARFVTSPQPVPTNHVTATGAATVSLTGNQVTVTLDTNGLLDGSPHAMHIHAGGIGACPPASAARQHNHHLAIDTVDGLHWYGPPEASLTLTGDTGATTLQHSILAFSRYPSVGNIRYKRTFAVPPGVAAAIRANDAVIVVHGIDYDHSGSYNDVLGQSQLNPGIPSEATAPALCGPLTGSQSASLGVNRGPRGSVFVATLRRPVTPTTSSGLAISFALLCHLLGLPTPAADAGTPPPRIRSTTL